MARGADALTVFDGLLALRGRLRGVLGGPSSTGCWRFAAGCGGYSVGRLRRVQGASRLVAGVLGGPSSTGPGRFAVGCGGVLRRCGV